MRRRPDSSKVPPFRLNARTLATPCPNDRPKATSSTDLGGHYSTTGALLADWLQRDEFRADCGI